MLPPSFAVTREEPKEDASERLRQKPISEYGKLYASADIVDPSVRAELYGRATEVVPSASPNPVPKPAPNPEGEGVLHRERYIHRRHEGSVTLLPSSSSRQQRSSSSEGTKMKRERHDR